MISVGGFAWAGSRYATSARIVVRPAASRAHNRVASPSRARQRSKGAPSISGASARKPKRRGFAPGAVQQGCDQRAVDDESRIALDTLRIVAVVVDAVGVEGERRIAEQEYRIGRQAAHRVGGLGFDCCGRRGRGRCCRGFAKDDVLLLADRGDAIRRNVVAQRHEEQVAARTALGLDRVDRGDAGQRGTDRDRCDELDAAARPHAARERDGREQARAVAARVTVVADRRPARGGQEIEPMGQRRHGARCPRRNVVIEQRREPGERCRGRDILARFAATDPGGIIVHRLRSSWAGRARASRHG